MKDLLIQGFADMNTEVGEGSLAWDAIPLKSCPTPIVLTPRGIVKDQAKVFDGSDSIKITKQIEKEKRNGIVASSSEDGIGICYNGANEREINDGSYELTDAATNGTVVVYVDEFLPKFVMGKPAGLFFGKWFEVTAVDERIDFPELFDNISNCEAGGFAHLKAPRVSRERVPPSNDLPGNPFLLVNTSHCTPQIQTKASVPSLSTNAGSTAVRSLSCA